MYGSLNLYSGDITIPGKVQGKTITATVDMNTNTIYASNWLDRAVLQDGIARIMVVAGI